jgi:protocatechuate 3,4-dioxygenase beta subunit
MAWSRRRFIQWGGIGFAAASTGELLLPAYAAPTQSSGTLGAYAAIAQQNPAPPRAEAPTPPANFTATEDNILGPYHRAGAPYRAKITPPLEPGTVLLIRGRVWGLDTRRPLAGATIDIWQANAQGRYDNDDPDRPPAPNVFVNRARLVTDENGGYEFETIHPGPYRIGPNSWRPPHIHYLVRHTGHRELITQLYFRGDPHQRTDAFIRDSLIIDLREQRVGQASYKTGTFDIILAPAARR